MQLARFAQRRHYVHAVILGSDERPPLTKLFLHPSARQWKRGNKRPVGCFLSKLRPLITVRRRPLNSQRQTSQALLAQRRFNSVRVAGSWMIPRLPVNMPRCGIATMSPNGVTRFCNGIGFSLLAELRPAWDRSAAAG